MKTENLDFPEPGTSGLTQEEKVDELIQQMLRKCFPQPSWTHPTKNSKILPMNDKNGPFFIEEELVTMYQEGLQFKRWNPTQVVYELASQCDWTPPEFAQTRSYRITEGFHFGVAVNGQIFLPQESGKNKKLAQHLASTHFLHFLGFKFNFSKFSGVLDLSSYEETSSSKVDEKSTKKEYWQTKRNLKSRSASRKGQRYKSDNSMRLENRHFHRHRADDNWTERQFDSGWEKQEKNQTGKLRRHWKTNDRIGSGAQFSPTQNQRVLLRDEEIVPDVKKEKCLSYDYVIKKENDENWISKSHGINSFSSSERINESGCKRETISWNHTTDLRLKISKKICSPRRIKEEKSSTHRCGGGHTTGLNGNIPSRPVSQNGTFQEDPKHGLQPSMPDSSTSVHPLLINTECIVRKRSGSVFQKFLSSEEKRRRTIDNKPQHGDNKSQIMSYNKQSQVPSSSPSLSETSLPVEALQLSCASKDIKNIEQLGTIKVLRSSCASTDSKMTDSSRPIEALQKSCAPTDLKMADTSRPIKALQNSCAPTDLKMTDTSRPIEALQSSCAPTFLEITDTSRPIEALQSCCAPTDLQMTETSSPIEALQISCPPKNHQQMTEALSPIDALNCICLPTTLQSTQISPAYEKTIFM